MRRYLELYKTFFLSSLVREMEFRANFFAKIVLNLSWIVFFLLLLLVIYRNSPSIAGWNEGDGFILGGTSLLIYALHSAFFFALLDVPSQIRLGTLDFIVTRPIDSQFWVSFRRFNIDQVGSILASSGMILFGIHVAGLHPSFAQIAAYLWLLLCSCALFYSLNLTLMTLSIWLVRIDNIFIISEIAIQFSRNPMEIFSTPFQRFLTYFVPIAFVAYLPASVIKDHVNGYFLLLGLGYSSLALFSSRKFWVYATHHYSSASA